MKKMNRFFAWFFGVLAFFELVGYFTGRYSCLIASVLLIGLSTMFYIDSRYFKSRKGGPSMKLK